VRLAEEAGIRFHMGQRVTEVLIEDGKARGIRLQDGRQEYAGCVVANADAPALYKQLVPARWRKRWTDRRIETRKFSMGLFVMYLGVRRQYPDVAHHTILLGERYKELLKDIFDDKILAEDLSLYLHAPTRTDPSLAPPGCESLYVLAPVPNLQAGIDWERERPRLEEHILDMLETTVCPGLRESLEVRFSVTPEHFRDNLLTHHGTGFSIQPTLLQSAWFRFHNRSEDVEGLYLVGAGTHPGAGLPGVLCSAKVLEHYIPEILSRDRNEPESSMVESQISPQGQEVTQ
jgi:phytoene desaturase